VSKGILADDVSGELTELGGYGDRSAPDNAWVPSSMALRFVNLHSRPDVAIAPQGTALSTHSSDGDSSWGCSPLPRDAYLAGRELILPRRPYTLLIGA
jgi:hypothetical protein